MKKTPKPKTAVPPIDKQRARIEYMELGELRKFPKNPKGHDDAALAEAFADRGFVDPLLVDETSGLLVEGHGRIKRLEAMRADGEKPPGRIEVRDGRWYVPVTRGIWFADLAQAKRHLLGANRIGEGLWDNRLTAAMLSSLGDKGLLGTGFRPEDLASFIALATGPTAPGSFPEVGADLPTQFCCPKCQYRWSGNPAPGAEPAAAPEKKRAARAK